MKKYEPPRYDTSKAWGWHQALDPLRVSSTSGSSVASFLLGYPASGSFGLSERLALERKYSALYFHDDWKVTRKLTLNLELPYSFEVGPPKGSSARPISISMLWRPSCKRPAFHTAERSHRAFKAGQ